MAPRPLRPKDERTPSKAEEKPSEPPGNKRRAVSSACIPCRKRKSKCDGALPACSTCTAVYRTECVYDAGSDHRRTGALKRDLQSLQQRNDAFDVIVTSLRNLPENEAIALLHSIRGDANLDALATSLRTNVDLPQNFSYQTLNPEFEQLSPAPSSSRGATLTSSVSRENSTDDGQLHSGAVTPGDASSFWFSTPQDPDLVQYLLNLYFCWVHPVHQLFSRERFLNDMAQARTEYCSSCLLNAILALACEYSDRPSTRLIPMDPLTAGDAFFTEARRLLETTEDPSLTKIQTLMVMGIREASHGRDSRGYQYIGAAGRMSLELGLHLAAINATTSAEENEVRSITLWAVFFLETMFAVFVGRLSQLPRTAIDAQMPILYDRMVSELWQRCDDTVSSAYQQSGPSPHPALFLHLTITLTEIASDVGIDVYAAREHERFTTRKLALAYDRYHEWFRQLPDICRLEQTTLPHVIILHMLYYGSILQPYVKLDLRGANLYPHDTCTLCANEISRLSSIFRVTHGLRRVCPPFTSLLLSASTIHLLNLPTEESTAHLRQAVQDLETISLHHHFAARCVSIIHTLAERWRVKLPDGAGSYGSSFTDEFPEPLSSNIWSSYPHVGVHQSEPSPSNFSNQDFAFLPLPLLEQPSAALPEGSSDPTITTDSRYAEATIWTPLLPQFMPASRQNLAPPVPTQSSTGDEHDTSWTLADRSASSLNPQSSANTQQRRSSGYKRP